MPELTKIAAPRPAPPPRAPETRPVESDVIRVETVDLDFFYGKTQALFGVSLAVPELPEPDERPHPGHARRG